MYLIRILACTFCIYSNVFALHKHRMDHKPLHKNYTPPAKKLKVLSRLEYETFLTALNRGQVDKVCEIIDEGIVDVNNPLFKNIHPLHIAVQRGHFQLVKVLIERYGAYQGIENAIYKSLEQEDIRIIDCLIPVFRGDINAAIDPKTGNTPLHFGFQKRNLKLIKTLIENHKADYTVFNKDGLMPIALLATMHVTETIKEIFDYFFTNSEFCVDAQVSRNGSTLLHLAVSNNNSELVALLVERYSANKESLDFEFETPLYLAHKNGFTKINHFFHCNT